MPARPSIRYRTLRVRDYDEVYAIWKKAKGIGLGESDSRQAIARYLRRNAGLSQVAVCDGRVIAAVLCGHDGRRGYLHHLAVARKWRRKGVGRGLAAACIEKLHKEGISKCNLFLFAANRPARAFWTRLGWSVRADLLLVQRETAGAKGPRLGTC